MNVTPPHKMLPPFIASVILLEGKCSFVIEEVSFFMFYISAVQVTSLSLE